MKLQFAVIAALSMAIGACSSPKSPTDAAAPAAGTPTGTGAQAKRAPGQEDAPPLHIFRAFGNEPFWNVNVEGDTLTFTTPEDQVGQVMRGQRRVLDDGLEISGSHEDQAFVLTVSGGLCSDGMSDNQYELESTFKLGDAEYKGCGEVAK